MNCKVFVICTAACLCAWGQSPGSGFGGPSILSRGTGNAGQTAGPATGFKFYGGVSGIYDSGLTPVSVSENGKLVEVDHLLGVEGTLGVYGRHRWVHSSLGLSYSGSYRDYTQNSYYNGSDHTLNLDAETQLSRRISLISRNAAGTVSRTLGGLYGFASTPDALLGVPNNEIFDNRAYFLQSSEQFVYQKSARLSFSGGGNAFFVRRQSKALIGVDGYGAQGTLAFRLSRASTIDVSYSYSHYDYPRAFGETDINQITGGYSRALNRTWQFALMGGIYKVDTIGITSVALDPATAALFGQQTSVQAFHSVKSLPALGASLSARFKRSDLEFGYGRQPNPGNGVYLTSNSESGSARYTYNGISRWSFTASMSYNRLKSIGQLQLGSYSYVGGGVAANYRIARSLHAGLRYDARQAQIDQLNGYSRLGSRVTVSLDYSPGERPLSIWR